MESIKRGHIYWVDLNPTRGSEIKKVRPCVVFGVDPINRARRTVIVIPLSSAGIPNPPLVFKVRCKDKNAVAVIDQIRAVDKSRFQEKIGTLTDEETRTIEEGLRIVLGL